MSIRLEEGDLMPHKRSESCSGDFGSIVGSIAAFQRVVLGIGSQEQSQLWFPRKLWRDDNVRTGEWEGKKVQV